MRKYGGLPRVRPAAAHPRASARLQVHVKQSDSPGEKTDSEKKRRAFVQRLVDRGMKARPRTGKLMTGQLYVALDHDRTAPDEDRPDAEISVGVRDLEARKP